MLKQLFELFWCDAGVPNDAAHGIRVDRVVPGDGEDPRTIGHDDVFAFASNLETSFHERPNSTEMGNSRDASHGLSRDLDFPEVLLTGDFAGHFEVFADSIPNVSEGIFFGGPLRPATGQARAGDAITLSGLDQRDWILHVPNLLRWAVIEHVRSVFKFRAFLEEHEVHATGRAVALLGQNQFGQPLRSSRSRL